MVHCVGFLGDSGNAWGDRIPDLPSYDGGGDSAESAIAETIPAAREWTDITVAKPATCRSPGPWRY